MPGFSIFFSVPKISANKIYWFFKNNATESSIAFAYCPRNENGNHQINKQIKRIFGPSMYQDLRG